MNHYDAQSQMFKLLIHPTRLAILDILREGEQCVCHMEAVFGLRQAHISQHLMVLREAGLVTDRRDGWNIFYQVNKPEIYQVLDAMNRVTGVEPADTRTLALDHHCPCPKCNTELAAFTPQPADACSLPAGEVVQSSSLTPTPLPVGDGYEGSHSPVVEGRERSPSPVMEGHMSSPPPLGEGLGVRER